MRRFKPIYAAFAACVLLFSCNTRALVPDRQEPVLVQITAPGSCGFGMQGSDAQTTKASKAGEGSDGFDELFIDANQSIGNLHSMPKGSTLWLLIEVPGPGYQYKPSYSNPSEVEKPSSWVESEYSYKPYIVGDNGAMYPCETRDSSGTRDGKTAMFRVVKRDPNGQIQSSGSALMLPPGLYKFHAVSPASPLLTTLDGAQQSPSVHISNGQYVQATDIRWRETYPKGVLIRGGTEVGGVQNIKLAALANQTARIKVNIRCGDDHVRKLALQKSGIEISGIQEDSHADFRWTIDGDPIQTRIGNKYAGIRFRDYEEKKDSDGRDMITAYASILPTDARANTIYVLFHLIVNNVPTQYMVGLTNQLYEAANQYTFNFRVRMDGNVTVGTWDNNTLIYEDLEL